MLQTLTGKVATGKTLDRNPLDASIFWQLASHGFALSGNVSRGSVFDVEDRAIVGSTVREKRER
jgi:hypothetical protein